MARSVGSTFDPALPIAKEEHVGAINWGFVAGKTQTYLPWGRGSILIFLTSRRYGFTRCCVPMGTPYREAEVNLIRRLTGKQ
jgi:hypothetical protein